MGIPVNEPLLDGNELKYVTDCVETAWISSAGKYIKRFEDEWAEYCGRKYGIAVTNGTAALQLALASIGIEPGDEVILPSFTIISCALAVVYNGGVPVLVDCDPETWCMDVSQVEEKITEKTKAVMPVHMYGHPVDMDPLFNLSAKYGFAIVEDAAQVHGAEYRRDRGSVNPKWVKCGSMGDVSCFSFYANKQITSGEGGMVLTDHPDIAEKAALKRNLCFEPGRRFVHKELGFNFRMTNLQAALAVAQVERMDRIVEKKRWMGAKYTERLKDVAGLQLPTEQPWAKNVFWMYSVVLDKATGMDAAEFAAKLADKGIGTRPFFVGMHQQPAFNEIGLFSDESYPVTERISKQGLYLPSGLALMPDQVETVCDTVMEVLS